MQVVEVIPIVKGITKPTLSYFTSEKFQPGTFVKVPVRNGTTLAIVERSYDARTAKAEIKKSAFSLKKLTKINNAGSLSPSFMRAAQATGEFYASTTGSVLSALIPKLFFKSPELLGKPIKEKIKPRREIRLIQLPDSERFREYRGIIRECFAKNVSILLIVPRDEEVLRAYKTLSPGIEDYVYLKKTLAEARLQKHPILLIATPALISFDRPDMEMIILEHENSSSYRPLSRPYIHLRTFLKYLAKESGKTLIFGDSVLSLETLWREREGEYVEYAPLTWRTKPSIKIEIVDVKKEKFQIFSPELQELVAGSLRANKKIFLFGARKGLAPLTVCGDCGSLLLCANCQAPLILHETPRDDSSRIYTCHHCRARRSAETRCDTCNSWKLVPLGIGTSLIAEEIKKLFPTANVFLLDKDRAPTASQAKIIIKKYLLAKNTILVGTELAFSYLTEVPSVAVVSLDSLFSIPDFGINERIFYLVNHLRQMTSEHFLIQTRNAGEMILRTATEGNVLDFYRTEIAEREELRYPPFSIFIKVSTDGAQPELERKAGFLQNLFHFHAPHFIIENHGSRGAQKRLSMVIRVPRETWPERSIRDNLLLLPPDFLIKVDPESIL